MKKSTLIIGAGYLGTRMAEILKCDLSGERINTINDALTLIKKYRPKIILNCIGHTGKNNVDDCELLPDKTLTANSFVPVILAEACIRNRVKLIHISSGCIFQNRPRSITEDACPDFLDLFYSRTKIYAERTLETLSRQYDILIPRIRIPLDHKPHPRNLLTKLISFKKAIAIPNSISYIPDTAQAIKHLITVNATGIYNVVNKGGLRYPQLLDVYRKFVPDFHYEIMDVRDLPTPRTNLILSTQKLEKTGFQVRPIQKVLVECVQNYLKSS